MMTAGLVVVAGATAQAESPEQAPSTSFTTIDGTQLTAETEAYLSTLRPAERAQFIATNIPATVDMQAGPQKPANTAALTSVAEAQASGGDLSPMATGCWTQRFTFSPKAMAGNVLYTYYHVGYWCSSGTRITAARVQDTGGQPKTLGWRYEGVVKRDAGIVSNQGRSYTQHKFVLGVNGWDIQTVLDCGRALGRTSGSALGDSVCGIY
ncbi:MAG: hypothetical protein Q4G67_13835 [Actinomycetia bacterium]|nr:hypothetical protein [Actinomycetes bacterium]